MNLDKIRASAEPGQKLNPEEHVHVDPEGPPRSGKTLGTLRGQVEEFPFVGSFRQIAGKNPENPENPESPENPGTQDTQGT